MSSVPISVQLLKRPPDYGPFDSRRKSGSPAKSTWKSATSEIAARPFVKWAGGKRQLLPELLRRMPPNSGRYHEPFVGGGALFFALAESGRIERGQARLSDINAEL